MIRKHIEDVKPEAVSQDGANGVTMRVMLGEPDGAPTFNLRVFEIEPGGNTPHHSHPYEHELFILEGAGEILLDGAFQPIAPNQAILVPPNEEHTIRNTGEATLRLICLVPQDQGPAIPAGAFPSC